MPRVQKGAARRQSKKRVFNDVKGFRGPRSKNWRLVQESRTRSLAMAQSGRRLKKRQFRRLWVTRLSAACQERGIRYSQFIFGLKMAQVGINRKMLSELALNDPKAFDEIVEIARKAATEAA